MYLMTIFGLSYSVFHVNVGQYTAVPDAKCMITGSEGVKFTTAAASQGRQPVRVDC